MEVLANVRYERREEVGLAGQNSRVFRAFDHHLHAELAIKEIEKARIGDAAAYFAEAKAIHASTHPRVVPIHWAAERDQQVCLAMPLMVGGSLADAIGTGPLRASRLMRMAQDLCEGVAHVHLAGYVHLDVKPSNVLFDADGRAAVSDFGLALATDYSGIADARDAALYPSFRPPEEIRKGFVTHAADVYQIGLTLYRAANGEPYFHAQWDALRSQPWPAAREAIRDGKFPDRTFLPSVPRRIRQTIKQALEVDPARRPLGARALAEDLALVEIRHDWCMDKCNEDEMLWRLAKRGRVDVLIRRVGALPAASVEVFTESPRGRRRVCPQAWATGLRTDRQARKALSRAFRIVEANH